MQRKKGISLIVLVITIIVMIILAAAIIISLTNNGIIGRANQAVDSSNLANVQNLAAVLWAEAKLDDNITTEDQYKTYIENGLGLNGIDTSKYKIIVTTSGVAVREKGVELPKDIKVGDIVEYTPTSSYTASNPYTVSLPGCTGTFYSDDLIFYGTTTREKTEWIVLSIDEENETIELIPNASSNSILSLTGANGYNNGITALNDICASVYGNALSVNYTAIAESMTAEDVHLILGYTPTESSTSLDASTLAERANYFPIEYLKEKKVASPSEVTVNCGYASNSNITVNHTAYSDCWVTPSGKFSTWGTNYDCYVATRCVSISNGTASFGLFGFQRYGIPSMAITTLFKNDGTETTGIVGATMNPNGGRVMPVVTMTLKKNLILDKTEGTGDDAINYWKFAVKEIFYGGEKVEDITVAGPWTKSGFTVTNGKESLQIGDTVYYDATKGGTISGLTATNWKVLGADASGNLLIMSTKDVGMYAAAGKDDWANIVSVLGALCEPYGKGTGAIGVRSITADDVNGVTGFDKTKAYKYGVSRTYYYNGTNTDFAYEDTDGEKGTTGTWQSYTSFVYYNGTEFVTVDDFTSKSEGVMATVDFVDAYSYVASSLTTISKTANSKAYTMIFGNDDARYNLATRYQYPGTYSILAVTGGAVAQPGMGGIWSDNGGSSGMSSSLGVRPVVTLDKNITLTGNSVSGWNL